MKEHHKIVLLELGKRIDEWPMLRPRGEYFAKCGSEVWPLIEEGLVERATFDKGYYRPTDRGWYQIDRLRKRRAAMG